MSDYPGRLILAVLLTDLQGQDHLPGPSPGLKRGRLVRLRIPRREARGGGLMCQTRGRPIGVARFFRGAEATLEHAMKAQKCFVLRELMASSGSGLGSRKAFEDVGCGEGEMAQSFFQTFV